MPCAAACRTPLSRPRQLLTSMVNACLCMPPPLLLLPSSMLSPAPAAAGPAPAACRSAACSSWRTPSLVTAVPAGRGRFCLGREPEEPGACPLACQRWPAPENFRTVQQLLTALHSTKTETKHGAHKCTPRIGVTKRRQPTCQPRRVQARAARQRCRRRVGDAPGAPGEVRSFQAGAKPASQMRQQVGTNAVGKLTQVEHARMPGSWRG
jgi:hypothetical protein